MGDPGDPALAMWFLRWFPWAVLHGHNPLFTHHMNAPDGMNLMWNTATPFPAVLLAPITLTLGPMVAFNAFSTLALGGSGWTCTLMLRRFVTSRVAAITGGLLYAFSPFMIGHVGAGHPHMPFALIPPLMVIVLRDLLVVQRRPPAVTGALLGLLAFLQLMTSSELLASSFLVAALGLVVLVVCHRDRVRAHAPVAVRGLAIAAAVALALSAAPLLFQFFGPRRVLGGSIWGPEIFVNDALAFFVPTGHQLFRPHWAQEITGHYSNACCGAEWDGYLGLPLLVLAVVTVARFWRRGVVVLAGVLAAIVVVLSTGPHLHIDGLVTTQPMPFSFLSSIPLVHNMFPARLMVHAFLMLALLVAIAVEAALRAERPWRGAGLAAVVVALAPLIPAVDFHATPSNIPAFFTSGSVRTLPAGRVALLAPFSRDTSTADSVLWQTYADFRFRMPAAYGLGPDENGRYSFLPIPTVLSTTMQDIQRGAPPPDLTPDLSSQLWRDMARADVRSVIVGPMGNQPAMVEFFTMLLGRAPVSTGGVYLWRGVRPRAQAGLPR